MTATHHHRIHVGHHPVSFQSHETTPRYLPSCNKARKKHGNVCLSITKASKRHQIIVSSCTLQQQKKHPIVSLSSIYITKNKEKTQNYINCQYITRTTFLLWYRHKERHAIVSLSQTSQEKDTFQYLPVYHTPGRGIQLWAFLSNTYKSKESHQILCISSYYKSNYVSCTLVTVLLWPLTSERRNILYTKLSLTSLAYVQGITT